jgi:hypothetical protein
MSSWIGSATWRHTQEANHCLYMRAWIMDSPNHTLKEPTYATWTWSTKSTDWVPMKRLPMLFHTKSQEQRGRESLSEFVSTQLNKRVLFHYQVLIISEIHRVFIQGTTLLVGCEWTFEFLELCYVKSHHKLKSRTASCDCWLHAQSSLNRS